ncbi:hypothetical protein KR222_002532 [Zaprionus bogoriensis]|nr:hypothetical protein KR222_002532 [Zaprionus bogoriensis]
MLTLIAAICCCLGFGLAAAPAAAPAAASAATSNFYLELGNVVRNVPQKQIEQLFRAYALNDEQFQALLRELNSVASYRVRRQLLNQPELRQLVAWVGQQLALAGGSFKIFDELEPEFKLFNKYPHWSQSVNGIAGFEQELATIYPATLLRNLLETSAQQSPIFAEFWRRVIALKPAYERFAATAPAKAFAERLRALGVNTSGIDSVIRYQLGWSNETLATYDYYDYIG